jgi:hypothetical protein
MIDAFVIFKLYNQMNIDASIGHSSILKASLGEKWTD